jgi:hypothetical protein
LKAPHDDEENDRKGLKTPHDDEEKVRRRRKAPHADAKTTEQRSFPGMKMKENQFAPHWRIEGEGTVNVAEA